MSGLQAGIGEFTGLLGVPLGQGAGMGASGLTGTSTLTPAASMLTPGAARPGMPIVEHPVPAVPTMPAPEIPARLMPAAAMGQAARVGGLSVPSSWNTATPKPVASSGAPLASAAPMMAPRGIPAGQVGGMEARALGAPVPARASVLPQLVG